MTRKITATFRIRVVFDPDRRELKDMWIKPDPYEWEARDLLSALASFPGNPVARLEEAECTWLHRENSVEPKNPMES